MHFARSTLIRTPLRLMDEAECYVRQRRERLESLVEELQLTRRDVLSRLNRKIREKATPLTNKLLRARRERMARDREHSQKGVMAPPSKHLSTRLRVR